MSSSLKLDAFLPYRLSLLSNTVSGAIAELYAGKFALSMTQWRVIAILAESPECSAEAVCTRMEVDKGTVSRAVANLLERGYLKRRFSPHDRRRSILALSARGRTIYERIAPLALDYEQALLRELSGAERALLASLLQRLLSRARTLRAELRAPRGRLKKT